MANRVLRDQCEHGLYDQHMYRTDSAVVRGDWEQTEHCSGGREVTIDHEWIEEILDELCRDWYDMVIREGKTFDFGAAIRALDAALGVADEGLTASRHYFDEAAKRDG